MAREANDLEEGSMSGYALARLDEIDEVDDGRKPFWAVRHHFGITAFGGA